MNKKRSILVISDINIPCKLFIGGGAQRSMRSIMEYSKYFNVNLVIPRPLNIPRDKFKELMNDLNVDEIVDFTIKNNFITLLHDRYPALLYIGSPSFTHRLFIKVGSPKNIPNAIVILTEPVSYIALGETLKEKYDVPSMVLFQLPVFYSNEKRWMHILQAYRSWYSELYRDSILSKYISVTLRTLELRMVYSKKMRKLIESHDVLVAVSRSIPLEMGEEWVGRFHVLDPGVHWMKRILC